MGLKKTIYNINPWRTKTTHGYVLNVQIIKDNLTFITLNPLIEGIEEATFPVYAELDDDFEFVNRGKFLSIKEKPIGFLRSKMRQEIVGENIYYETLVEWDKDNYVRKEYEEDLEPVRSSES